MRWLSRLFTTTPTPTPTPAPLVARQPSALGTPRGIVRLPSGEVRAFVAVRLPHFSDRATFHAWLPRWRLALASLPGGAQPCFADDPGPTLWVAVWSPQGNVAGVLAAVARVRQHLAPMLQRWPVQVTAAGELQRLSDGWHSQTAVPWTISYVGETWCFDWSPGQATVRRLLTGPGESVQVTESVRMSGHNRRSLPA